MFLNDEYFEYIYIYIYIYENVFIVGPKRERNILK